LTKKEPTSKKSNLDIFKPIPQEDLNTYLRRFPKVPLLTSEEEKIHGRILKSENSSESEKNNARKTLILSNTRLVVAEAVKFSKRSPKNISVIDLISEGIFGLFDAVRRYDPERECRFSTYATWWVRRYIRKAITGSRVIRIPYYMNGILSRIPWAHCELVSKLGRDPTPVELAEHLEIKVSDLDRTQSTSSTTKVFNPSSESPDGDPMNTVQDHRDSEQEFAFDENKSIVWKVLGKMEKRKSQILMLWYGFYPRNGKNGKPKKYTFSEIGNIYGVSREKARMLEKSAEEDFIKIYLEEKEE